jgi:hypothetical protein
MATGGVVIQLISRAAKINHTIREEHPYISLTSLHAELRIVQLGMKLQFRSTPCSVPVSVAPLWKGKLARGGIMSVAYGERPHSTNLTWTPGRHQHPKPDCLVGMQPCKVHTVGQPRL